MLIQAREFLSQTREGNLRMFPCGSICMNELLDEQTSESHGRVPVTACGMTGAKTGGQMKREWVLRVLESIQRLGSSPGSVWQAS